MQCRPKHSFPAFIFIRFFLTGKSDHGCFFLKKKITIHSDVISWGLTHFMIEWALLWCDRSRFPWWRQVNFHYVVAALLPLACMLQKNCQCLEQQTQNTNSMCFWKKLQWCMGLQALTHVIEMLPKGLHPPVCVLAAVCGQCVGDLLPSVLVADADILNFIVRLFLRRPYSGLLKPGSDKEHNHLTQNDHHKEWMPVLLNEQNLHAATSDHYAKCKGWFQLKISCCY